jgi:hypothetical protein
MISDEDFLKNFSQEELELLEKLYKTQQEMAIDSYDELKNNADEYAEEQYKSIMGNEALLDSPVELIFVINCVVLNKNDSGEVVSHDQILNKNYHVPLLNKQQVKEYIEGFFRKFQTSATQQVQETIKADTNE